MGHTNEAFQIFYDNVEIDLAQLAALTTIATSSKIDTARTQGFRVTRMEMYVGANLDLSASGALQSIMFGYAMNPVNTQAITDALVADPQQGFTMADARLDPMHPVFPVCMFVRPDLTSADQGITVNNGLPIVIKQPWSCPEGGSMLYWAHNTHDADALEGANNIRIFNKIFGVWLKD